MNRKHKRSKKEKKTKDPPKPAAPSLIHIGHPAAVINTVDPCHIPSAPDVLDAFEHEVYPSGTPRQFFVQFSRWGHLSVPENEWAMVATAVFPREGIQRLAEICRDHELILVRGVLTMIEADTGARAAFDYAPAVANVIDTIPEPQDVYTFDVRKSKDDPLIVCGHHEFNPKSGVVHGCGHHHS